MPHIYTAFITSQVDEDLEDSGALQSSAKEFPGTYVYSIMRSRQEQVTTPSIGKFNGT